MALVYKLGGKIKMGKELKEANKKFKEIWDSESFGTNATREAEALAYYWFLRGYDAKD